MELAICQGASPSQYKTPICINSSEALAVLESNVLACFFSDKSPTNLWSDMVYVDYDNPRKQLDHIVKNNKGTKLFDEMSFVFIKRVVWVMSSF